MLLSGMYSGGIVNLLMGTRRLTELERGKKRKAARFWGRLTTRRPCALWLPRFTPGIGPVKWHDIPQHANGVFEAGDVERLGQMLRESVVLVLPIETAASSFHAAVLVDENFQLDC